MSLFPAEFIKTVQNEVLHIQHTTHNALTLFRTFTVKFKSGYSL
jgi:hypothetical protein